MIARMWSGMTRPEQADAYLAHLRDQTFRQLAAIPGHRGACVLRRATPGTVTFTVITLWDSLAAIARFASDDPEGAVVPPAAQALTAHHDARAVHWDVAHREIM